MHSWMLVGEKVRVYEGLERCYYRYFALSKLYYAP